MWQNDMEMTWKISQVKNLSQGTCGGWLSTLHHKFTTPTKKSNFWHLIVKQLMWKIGLLEELMHTKEYFMDILMEDFVEVCLTLASLLLHLAHPLGDFELLLEAHAVEGYTLSSLGSSTGGGMTWFVLGVWLELAPWFGSHLDLIMVTHMEFDFAWGFHRATYGIRFCLRISRCPIWNSICLGVSLISTWNSIFSSWDLFHIHLSCGCFIGICSHSLI